MSAHYVYRLERSSAVLVGTLDGRGTSFSYDAEYLGMPGATPLSLSLPLRLERFGGEEIRPYFEGLLAEGRARTVLAAELGIAEEDWVGMLAACGRDALPFLAFAVTFGGGSILAQQIAFLKPAGVKIKLFLAVKFLQGIAAAGACALFLAV